jgi:hypothetical protein
VRLVVAQLGARMHYAVPRTLQKAGLLERFFTDVFLTERSRAFVEVCASLAPAGHAARLRGRYSAQIDTGQVTAFTRFGLQYALGRRLAGTASELTNTYLWAGKTFCRLVLDAGFGSATAVYTFNSAGLEILQEARKRGLTRFMEQTIAPRNTERRLLQQEAMRFPNWQEPPSADAFAQAFADRERAEWDCADVIFCGSDFVKDMVAEEGGPSERCVVIPYGVETAGAPLTRSRFDGPLRVLMVGSVSLRKGAQYVFEAAKRLGDIAQFRAVGQVQLFRDQVTELSQVVELIGSVPRDQVREHYLWADVFLLPSLVEGSATATYEAMAAGLPVICTPNAGSVVDHEVDGFIVPVRDVSAIVDVLRELASNPGRL